MSVSLRGRRYSKAYKNGYSVWGNAYNPKETAMAHYIWVFYVSKIYEFLDTFIMLLKNNLKQVSFLHVYHHATISFMWWMIAHRAPGGDAYFSAALNSWVHVCMYTYYLMVRTEGGKGRAPGKRSEGHVGRTCGKGREGFMGKRHGTTTREGISGYLRHHHFARPPA